jgi:hypothetical protein
LPGYVPPFLASRVHAAWLNSGQPLYGWLEEFTDYYVARFSGLEGPEWNTNPFVQNRLPLELKPGEARYKQAKHDPAPIHNQP